MKEGDPVIVKEKNEYKSFGGQKGEIKATIPSGFPKRPSRIMVELEADDHPVIINFRPKDLIFGKKTTF